MQLKKLEIFSDVLDLDEASINDVVSTLRTFLFLVYSHIVPLGFRLNQQSCPSYPWFGERG
jgi:hypothetical protein